MECEQGRLHQNSAFCRADIAPLEGCEPNVGRILATTFGNRWFPLLRFEIGDLARISPDPCPCGRSFGLTLSSIEGRSLSIFLAPGRGLVSHRQLDQAIAAVEGIDEYRLDQESPRCVRLRLVPSTGRRRQSVLGEAREAVHALLGDGIALEVQAVKRLLPEASGKFLLAKRHFPLAVGASPKPGDGNGS